MICCLMSLTKDETRVKHINKFNNMTNHDETAETCAQT